MGEEVQLINRHVLGHAIGTGEMKCHGNACGGSLPKREKAGERERGAAELQDANRHRLPLFALTAPLENHSRSYGGGGGDYEQSG